MESKFITIEHGETVSVVRLNRPERRNALNFEVLAELHEALESIGQSDARALILEAAGNVFCSGHDFEDLLAREQSGLRRMFQVCAEIMMLMRALPQPVIAAVQGPAIGAGAQLALSCDLVVASSTATFQTPGGKGGWFCHTPGVAVARATSTKRALEMLFTGETVSADTALAWGMINRSVEPDKLSDEAMELALRASRGSRSSKALGKQTFYNQIEMDDWHAYQFATEVMASSALLPDGQETMQAFVEKRPADFDEGSDE